MGKRTVIAQTLFFNILLIIILSAPPDRGPPPVGPPPMPNPECENKEEGHEFQNSRDPGPRRPCIPKNKATTEQPRLEPPVGPQPNPNNPCLGPDLPVNQMKTGGPLPPPGMPCIPPEVKPPETTLPPAELVGPPNPDCDDGPDLPFHARKPGEPPPPRGIPCHRREEPKQPPLEPIGPQNPNCDNGPDLPFNQRKPGEPPPPPGPPCHSRQLASADIADTKKTSVAVNLFVGINGTDSNFNRTEDDVGQPKKFDPILLINGKRMSEEEVARFLNSNREYKNHG